MNVKLTVPVIIDDLNYELSGEITNEGFDVRAKIKNVDDLIDRYFKDPNKADSEFIQIIKLILPNELEFGYKRSKALDGSQTINTFILGGAYEWVKFYVYFDEYGTYFKLETNKSIDFNALPLVGDYLSAGYGISKLEFIYIPEKYKNNDISNIKFQNSSTQLLKKKINLLLELNLGGLKKHFVYHSVKDADTVQGEKKIDQTDKYVNPSNVPNQNTAQQAPAKPSPITFENIAPIFSQEGIGLSVTAGINIAGFTFKMIGLGLTVPYSIFKDVNFLKKIDFTLKGMSMSYSKGNILIEGAFLRKESKLGLEFNGVISLQFSKISLSLIGSYIKTKEYSSLFAFGYSPIAIPIIPAFNIQGIAAGFGINRNFTPPSPSQIPTFPLIKMMEGEKIDNPEAAFDLLNSYLTPRKDSTILMAGIKFDSFKVVTTSAIVYAVINDNLNFGLLGLTKFAKPNIYNIQIAFSANYNVKVGLLKIEAALYNSYLFIPEISIRGEMAFYLWFKGADKTNAGDFVLTIGGYHPRYIVPSHYPKITTRLSVEFTIGSNITIKGGVYMALTPSCIMAGIYASLQFKKSLFGQEAEHEVKKKKKWWQKVLDFIIDIVKGLINIHVEVGLDFQADFLIYWNPFAYEADISVRIYGKASITGLFSQSIEVSLSAYLNVYGPSFSGRATLEVLKYKIAIEFGKGREIPSFTASDFKKQYLPEVVNNKHNLLSVNVLAGIIKKVKKGGVEHIIVDPKIFEVEVKSKVPIKEFKDLRTDSVKGRISRESVSYKGEIFPMHTNAKVVNTKLTITSETSGDFIPSVITDNLPKSIWNDMIPDFSKKIELSTTNKAFLNNVPVGIKFVFNKIPGGLDPKELKLYDTFKSYMEETKNVANYVATTNDIQPLGSINVLSKIPDVYKYKDIYGSYTV